MEGTWYLGDKHHVQFYPHFLSSTEAESLFTHLESLDWKPNRRSHHDYGDPGVSYKLTFGSKIIERKVKPWEELPALIPVRERLSQLTRSPFNYCVLLRYPNGNIGIDPHRDKEIRTGTPICGISLGANRKLTLTPPRWSNSAPINLELPSGSLYILYPPTNDYWAHCIEKEPQVKEPRISLTFRLQ